MWKAPELGMSMCQLDYVEAPQIDIERFRETGILFKALKCIYI